MIINIKTIKQNWTSIVLALLFMLHLFFRFYDLENKIVFGWDQVDNAWVAKEILLEHKYPLVGMVAKQNTGFFIGPLYYYIVALFYALFNMDPIASGFIAGVSSILTFCVLYIFIKKLFSIEVALVALFIHTVSMRIIDYDRLQWPINLVAPISLIIFYTLYRVIEGKEKFILPLTVAIGFSFHLNFTSVFFPLIVLCALPFFPRTKKTLKYVALSIPLFILWFIPNIIHELLGGTSSKNMSEYLHTYYHGFHLRRFLQLTNDGLIEMGTLFIYKQVEFLKILVFPLFSYLYVSENLSRSRVLLCFLLGIWLLIPWLVFSVYSGEISDYYFSIGRPIALMLVSYIIFRILSLRQFLIKIIALVVLSFYFVINVQKFFVPKDRPLSFHRAEVNKAIKNNVKLEFGHGDPKSYMYYIFTKDKK